MEMPSARGRVGPILEGVVPAPLLQLEVEDQVREAVLVTLRQTSAASLDEDAARFFGRRGTEELLRLGRKRLLLRRRFLPAPLPPNLLSDRS